MRRKRGLPKTKSYKAAQMPLEEWLRLVLVPEHKRDYTIQDYCFPTDHHIKEYFASVHTRPENEVKDLIRQLLIPNGSLGADSYLIEQLSQSESFEDEYEHYEFIKRLFGSRQPWEGITWVIDLLPDNPQLAIDALDAYFTAHCQFIPDGCSHGLGDVAAIIRTRYFEATHPQDLLLGLIPRKFESLVASLYSKMGYQTKITQTTRDGGYDVEAIQTEAGRVEHVLIECKRYHDRVGVKEVRALNGVVEQERATKGIIVTTGDFTASARKCAASVKRIELIDFAQLNRLLNKHFGADWPNRIDTYMMLAARRESRFVRD